MRRLTRMLQRLGRHLAARPGRAFAATVVIFLAGGLLFRYGLDQASRPTVFAGVPAPVELQRAVEAIFSDDRCVGSTDAERLIRSTLDELRLGDWTIRRGAGGGNPECVAVGLDGETREVRFFMALGPEAQDVIEAAQEELLRSCHPKDVASETVEAMLIAEGMEEWVVRTDGPVSAPADRWDEIVRHVDRGCWILSTTGWTAEGAPVVWLAGK